MHCCTLALVNLGRVLGIYIMDYVYSNIDIKTEDFYELHGLLLMILCYNDNEYIFFDIPLKVVAKVTI